MRGPNNITNNAFPIMCHPKAAANRSKGTLSDTVNVKLLNAIPRKKPDVDRTTIGDEIVIKSYGNVFNDRNLPNNPVQLVCSANTEMKRKQS